MLDLKNIKIVYEDNHLIAVNKPAGWLVQGDATGDTPLSEYMKQYIKLRYKKPGDVFLGTIHRIDRPVSGVVIFARTSKALTRMNKLFQERKVKKTYWAVTKERPKDITGKLTHFLLKDHTKNVTKAYDTIGKRTSKAKKSVLTYELLGQMDGYCLLKINPDTGRSHQIRVQLSMIDCPIKGDIKYGFRHPNDDGSIHLHSRSMTFVHPVKKEEITIKADTPKSDFLWRQFAASFQD